MPKFLIIILLILFLTGCSQSATVPGGSILLSTNQNNMTNENIRQPMVAGQFYPNDAGKLQAMIDGYLQTVVVNKLAPPQAIIVPHAGLEFSGATAAPAFKQLQGWEYDRVVLIGPSHQQYFRGAAVLAEDYYQTPLGQIKIAEVNKELVDNELFELRSDVFDNEHALEIELPWLQTVLDEFELIPIIIGSDNSYEQLQAISQTIRDLLTDKTLLVVSTDFLHYGPNYNYVPFIDNLPENIQQIDEQAFTYIQVKDGLGFYNYIKDSGATIDGMTIIPVALEIFSNSEVVKLKYETSGNLFGDYTNSVSYAAFSFYEQTNLNLTSDQQDYLLKLARQSLTAAVNNQTAPKVDLDNIDKRLLIRQGVFVTLEKDGQLRGCIGYIPPYQSIAQAVIDNARSAALNDHRFNPVRSEELNDITVEVSVLSVPTLLTDKSKLIPGVDGLVLQLGNKQATYLPQVWEDLSDRESFLSSLSQKAGLTKDAWQNLESLWYVYQAVHFRE